MRNLPNFFYLAGSLCFMIGTLIAMAGCASRPQTCPPHDERCRILVEISKL